MLETYITKIENVSKKRVLQMVNYLVSEIHSNHKNTNIINYVDKTKFVLTNFEKIKLNGENRNNRKGPKGNELINSNKSLTFNFPVSYSPTKEQMEIVNKELLDFIIDLYSKNGVKISLEDIFYNFHFEKFKNRHINIITPTLDNLGNNLRFCNDENKFYKTLSKEFTSIVDKVMGTNIKNYISNPTIKQQEDKIKELEGKNKQLELNYKKKVQRMKQNIEDSNKTIRKNNQIIEEQKKKYESEIVSLKGENEKLAQEIEETTHIMENMDNLTLKDIQDLKEEKRGNKLLKRTYDYIYRYMSKKEQLENDLNILERIKSTIVKIQEDGVTDREELEEVLDILEGLGLDRKMFSKELKEGIRKSRKMNK